jgi:hypothetical protein
MKYLKILPLLIAGATGACLEDKGSYDHEPVPEARLARALVDTSIRRGQHLVLAPGLKINRGDAGDTTFNPGDYTYRWTAYRTLKDDMEAVELATTRDLDTNIYLPVHPDPYHVIYAVTRVATGVTWEFSFKLTITAGRFASAWLYLTEEDDGTVDLMVRGVELATGNSVLEGGVLDRSGFPYRGGGAKFVYYFYSPPGVSPRVFIGTGEGTGFIDRENFAWKESGLIRYMMAQPRPVDYTFDKIINMGVLHCFDSYGGAFPMSPAFGVMSPPYSILPPSATGAGYDTIRVAPFVAGTNNFGQLVYDAKNKRMMAYMGTSVAVKTYLDALPPAHQLPNCQIYHMQTYVGDRSAIIVKNLGDGKYYRHLYYALVLQPNHEEITNGQLLDRARFFECDYHHGFLYAVIDNKLHAFRTNADNTGSLREVRVTNRSGFSFDEITYLGRSVVTDTQYFVILATYAGNAGSGKVFYLKPDPTEPLDVTIEEEITGLDRVKSIHRF